MNFLIDENLSRGIARDLRALGHAAWHSADLLGESARDGDIWREAIARMCVIVSKDVDFIRFLSGSPPHCPVVWLRIGNCSTATASDPLVGNLRAIAEAIAAGELLIEIS